jgi:tuftelin-interacting protein 11
MLTQATKKRKSEVTIDKAKFGVGASLLQKMGWKGESGLGKNESGITQALEVKMRPANAGLGMVQEKTESQRILERQRREGVGAAEGEAAADGEQEEEPVVQIKWSKLASQQQPSSRNRKRGLSSVALKSSTQVLTEDAATSSAGVTIIDMTGPRERILDRTGTSSLVGSASVRVQVGRELKYNLDKLLEAAEAELKQQNRRLMSVTQKEDTFVKQVELLSKSLADAETSAATMREAETVLDRLLTSKDEMAATASASDDAMQELVRRLFQVFTRLRQKFGQQLYDTLGLSDVLFGILEAPLRDYYERGVMRPLDMAMAESLKTLWLDADAQDCWNAFVFQLVIPQFQRFLTREWVVTNDFGRTVSAIEQWKGVWGTEAEHYVVHELVWPRLKAEGERWNPYVAEIPLHQWVHPWHEIFEGRLEKELYPGLVYKLSTALQEWDPMDGSAYELLRPWQGFFTKSQVEGLAAGRILPKLTAMLSAMDINDEEGLVAFLKWHDWLPLEPFLKALWRGLFSRLARTVYDWMMSILAPRAIVVWYKKWKERFPPALLTNDKVRLMFAHLLDVVMNALQVPRLDFEPEVMPFDMWAPSAAAASSQKRAKQVEKLLSQVPMQPADAKGAFRAMVEAFAGEHNVVFIPLANRTHNGKPLYSFGGIPIMLAEQVVYAERNGAWAPVSLDHLANLSQLAAEQRAEQPPHTAAAASSNVD